MLKTTLVKGVLGVSAVAALFAALAVQAQTGAATGQGAGQGTAVAPAPLSRSDQKMIKDLALANLAEIEAARLAHGKSQNEQVRTFAQQMIDDHTKTLAEVQQLAQAKGVPLPTELDRVQKRKAARMAALSGDAFDRAYLSQAGVADHKKTHGLLQQAQARAKDPELKALVARTMPIVDQHLNSAEQLHKNTAVGSGATQGTTGVSPDKKE
jgi:putative membrane protein